MRTPTPVIHYPEFFGGDPSTPCIYSGVGYILLILYVLGHKTTLKIGRSSLWSWSLWTSHWTAGTVFVVVMGVLYWLKELRRKSNAVSVQNKVVLITGASSGLGEACAHVFYEQGAKVILASRRESELQRVKQDLIRKKLPIAQPHEPAVLVLDLAEFDRIPETVAAVIAEHGTVDILVNNGGISYRGEIRDTTLEVYRKVMDVNFFGQVALTKAVLPSMVKQQSGHIVAIPLPDSASKHAFLAFCDCLRAEVSDQNIRVSVMCPGYIQTNLSQNAITGNGTRYGVTDPTTASGMTPRDVASHILYTVRYDIPEQVLSTPVHRWIVYLRNVLPDLYFYAMSRRARKQRRGGGLNTTDSVDDKIK